MVQLIKRDRLLFAKGGIGLDNLDNDTDFKLMRSRQCELCEGNKAASHNCTSRSCRFCSKRLSNPIDLQNTARERNGKCRDYLSFDTVGL